MRRDGVASFSRNQRRKWKFSTSLPVRCTACGQRPWEINCTVNLEKSIWVYSVELRFTAWLEPSQPKTLSWPFSPTDAQDPAGCQCNLPWPSILLNQISEECLCLLSKHIEYIFGFIPDRPFKCPEKKARGWNIINESLIIFCKQCRFSNTMECNEPSLSRSIWAAACFQLSWTTLGTRFIKRIRQMRSYL